MVRLEIWCAINELGEFGGVEYQLMEKGYSQPAE
jgi:hypothetical protein